MVIAVPSAESGGAARTVREGGKEQWRASVSSSYEVTEACPIACVASPEQAARKQTNSRHDSRRPGRFARHADSRNHVTPISWALLPQQAANVVTVECAAEGLPAVGHGANQLRLALLELEHLLLGRVLGHHPVHH